MSQLVKKKEIDIFQGLIPDALIEKCVKDRFKNVNKWLSLPFINVAEKAILITRRSETARKAIILLDNNELVFIKELPWYCSSKKFVEYQTDLLLFLDEYNISVPKLIPTYNKLFYTKYDFEGDNKYLIVQEHIYGTSWKNTKIEALNAAAELRKLHKVLDSYYNKIDKTLVSKTNAYLKANQMLDVSLKSNKDKNKEKTIDLINYYKTKKHDLNIYKEELYKCGYLESLSIIHGDYNPSNMIFSQTHDILAIIDFDNSSIDNQYRDIVEMILTFCFFKYRQNTTRFSVVPKRFDIVLATEMIKKYFSGKLIENIEMIPSLAAIVSIELVALAVARFDFNDFNELYLIDKTVYNSFKKIIEEVKKNHEESAY